MISDPSSSPSLTPGEDIEEGEIFIFDGEHYVAVPTTSYSPVPLQPPSMPTLSLPLEMPGLSPNSVPMTSDALYYEKKTCEPDLWGHTDAGSWSIHAHGEDSLPLFPGFDNMPAPPGHPVWCANNGVPVVRQIFLHPILRFH
jgi:hypothetical protein